MATNFIMKAQPETASQNNSMVLKVEGEKVQFGDFIRANSAEGVTPLTEDDIQRILLLKVNESCFVGICKIQRIR